MRSADNYTRSYCGQTFIYHSSSSFCRYGAQVCDMKKDMSAMRHEVESVHNVKGDIDDLRECIDKLQEQNRRRKLRLLEQVPGNAIVS